jgi:hypothetical protein
VFVRGVAGAAVGPDIRHTALAEGEGSAGAVERAMAPLARAWGVRRRLVRTPRGSGGLSSVAAA